MQNTKEKAQNLKMANQLDRILRTMRIDKDNIKVFTLDEAIEYYGIKPSFFKTWLKQGIIPHYKLKDEILFHKDIIDSWLLGKIGESYKVKQLNVSFEKIEEKTLALNNKLNEMYMLSKKDIPKPKNYNLSFLLISALGLINMIMLIILLAN